LKHIQPALTVAGADPLNSTTTSVELLATAMRLIFSVLLHLLT